MALSRVYWIRALQLTRLLCRFMNRWHNAMPITLATETAVFLTAVNAYCDVLTIYDNTHARGKGVGPVQ